MRLSRSLQTAREDIQAVRKHDPATKSNVEVVLSYPGTHAIWSHRLAHAMWKKSPKLRVPARLVSQAVRTLTGIEIHPGAAIGRRFFIDRGVGVVIDGTAEVGDDCMFCHGVTLGGMAFVDKKRCPTLGDGAVVGTGAKILGPVTVGNGSHIGANVVVIKGVPGDSAAAGVPTTSRSRKREGVFYIDPAVWI